MTVGVSGGGVGGRDSGRYSAPNTPGSYHSANNGISPGFQSGPYDQNSSYGATRPQSESYHPLTPPTTPGRGGAAGSGRWDPLPNRQSPQPYHHSHNSGNLSYDTYSQPPTTPSSSYPDPHRAASYPNTPTSGPRDGFYSQTAPGLHQPNDPIYQPSSITSVAPHHQPQLHPRQSQKPHPGALKLDEKGYLYGYENKAGSPPPFQRDSRLPIESGGGVFETMTDDAWRWLGIDSSATFPVILHISDLPFRLLSLAGIERLRADALKYLDVSNQKLESLDELRYFKSLTEVKAASNMLRSCTFNSTSIRELIIPGNELQTFPNFGNMPNLEVINLADNKISKGLEMIEYCSKVKELDLSNNLLAYNSAEFVNATSPFGGLLTLTHLDLSGNPFWGNLTVYRAWLLASLPGIQVLDKEQIGKQDRTSVILGLRFEIEQLAIEFSDPALPGSGTEMARENMMLKQQLEDMKHRWEDLNAQSQNRLGDLQASRQSLESSRRDLKKPLGRDESWRDVALQFEFDLKRKDNEVENLKEKTNLLMSEVQLKDLEIADAVREVERWKDAASQKDREVHQLTEQLQHIREQSRRLDVGVRDTRDALDVKTTHADIALDNLTRCEARMRYWMDFCKEVVAVSRRMFSDVDQRGSHNSGDRHRGPGFFVHEDEGLTWIRYWEKKINEVDAEQRNESTGSTGQWWNETQYGRPAPRNLATSDAPPYGPQYQHGGEQNLPDFNSLNTKDETVASRKLNEMRREMTYWKEKAGMLEEELHIVNRLDADLPKTKKLAFGDDNFAGKINVKERTEIEELLQHMFLAATRAYLIGRQYLAPRGFQLPTFNKVESTFQAIFNSCQKRGDKVSCDEFMEKVSRDQRLAQTYGGDAGLRSSSILAMTASGIADGDRDKDGYIGWQEFRSTMIALSEPKAMARVTADDLIHIFKRADPSNQGSVQLREFTNLIEADPLMRTSFAHKSNLFDSATFSKFIDRNGDGRVSWDEFRIAFVVSTLESRAQDAMWWQNRANKLQDRLDQYQKGKDVHKENDKLDRTSAILGRDLDFLVEEAFDLSCQSMGSGMIVDSNRGKFMQDKENAIKAIFGELDIHRTGEIPLERFVDALQRNPDLERHLGHGGDTSQIALQVDVNGDGRITYREFRAAMIQSNDAQHPATILANLQLASHDFRAAFETMDTTREGVVRMDIFVNGVKKHPVLQRIFSSEAAQSDLWQVIRATDRNADGLVSWDEFRIALVKAVLKKNATNAEWWKKRALQLGASPDEFEEPSGLNKLSETERKELERLRKENADLHRRSRQSMDNLRQAREEDDETKFRQSCLVLKMYLQHEGRLSEGVVINDVLDETKGLPENERWERVFQRLSKPSGSSRNQGSSGSNYGGSNSGGNNSGGNSSNSNNRNNTSSQSQNSRGRSSNSGSGDRSRSQSQGRY